MRTLYFLSLLLLLPALAPATIIHVPSDSATIQAGINGAINGDTVLVAAGTYTGDGNRDIRYDGKAILVTSEAGAESTIIDLQKIPGYRAFVIEYYEDTTSILDGFTIKDNAIDGFGGVGGGILCKASPTIRNCIFTGCVACDGSAICVTSNGTPTITNCTFTGNQSVSGTITFWGSYGTIINCSFTDNHGNLGHVHCSGDVGYGDFVVKNCTFANNGPGGYCGGIYMRKFASLYVENCLFAFGTALSGIYCEVESGDIEIVGTDIYIAPGYNNWDGCIAEYEGINGNFSADPLFCDASNGDYTLSALSPCTPAHNSSGEYIGAWQVECGIVCGDANGDSGTNVADAVFMINFIFKNGPEPGPICSMDANGDSSSNVGDAVYMINYVFNGGPPPQADCCPGY